MNSKYIAHQWPTHRRASGPAVHPLPAPKSPQRAHVERLRALKHAGRKPIAFAAPMPGGTLTLGDALLFTLTTPRHEAKPCECGYLVCSKRGPCAPPSKREPACDRCGHRTAAHCTLCDRCADDVARAVTKPPAKALDNLPPASAPASDPLIGTRWRVKDCLLASWRHPAGMVLTVVSVIPGGRTERATHVIMDDGEAAIVPHDARDPRYTLEPIAEPAPAAQAEWTPEACGWTRTEQNGFVGYVYGASRWTTGVPRVERNVTSSRGWYHGNAKHGTGHILIGNPSLAQACCAALGIEIDRDEDERLYTPFLNGNCIAPGIFVTAEDAARAALQAHHQQAGRP